MWPRHEKSVNEMKLTQKQWAAIVRGLLAVAVAVLTSVIAGLSGGVAAPILSLTAILQGCIAFRAFLDTSNAKASAEAASIAAESPEDDSQDTPHRPANIITGHITPSWQQNSLPNKP